MTAYMGLDAPLHFRTLRRLRSVHAPTADYIVDRRLRGIPPEGLLPHLGAWFPEDGEEVTE
ncbi:MAG TPA: hypothetical protein VK054_00595 [Beutenbergiaceae bacterium]|nr:hypothetical protein [Beutenbergiaceae bacterium]